MPFDGLRVLSLESRRGPEMAALIRRQGGEAITEHPQIGMLATPSGSGIRR